MDKKGFREGLSDKNPGIFSILKSYYGRVSVLVLMALAGSAANMVIPALVSRAIDSFSDGSLNFRIVILQFAAAAAAIFLFTFLQSLFQTYTSEKVARDLRSDLSAKISAQSYSFVIKSNPSKLLTNLTSDIDSVKMFVSQAFVIIVSSLFMIVGVSVLLISINWKLALTVIAIVPVIAGAFFYIFKRVRSLFKKSRENVDKLNRIINESIMGSALIRVLNSQQPESTKFLEANVVSRDLGLSIVRLFSTLIPVIVFVANSATVAILALGGHYVVTERMTLGNFAAFNSYLLMLIFPIMMIGFMSNIIAMASAANQRINEVLYAPDLIEKGERKDDLKGNISVKDLSLSYEGKPVLKNVTFNIRAGTRTAIIGPTAAGKSQLLQLLAGLIPADSGSIEFEGIPIGDYDSKTFHNKVGIVFQDSVIFNMSLYENIAFSDNVTQESVEKAIQTAEIGGFIDTLPEKLGTIVSERGTSLSGGQKQRIMLARALALQPSVLLLDDFTARVDRKTENSIQCSLMNNYPDLTLISVTQKIAPVRHFEQIILLMEGEIIAIGSHKELLATSTEYVQIYDSQRSTHHYEL